MIGGRAAAMAWLLLMRGGESNIGGATDARQPANSELPEARALAIQVDCGRRDLLDLVWIGDADVRSWIDDVFDKSLMKLLVLANNLKQASYRVRIEAILPLLRQRGIEPTIGLRTGNLFENRRLFRSASDFHAVLLQRKLLESWEARTLRQHARKIFYDIDDAVMYHNRPVSWMSRWRTGRRFRATVRVLDHVVAGNEYLAEIFRQEGRPATVLPTVVDPARYLVKTHAPTPTPRLVWIGSHSTLPYLRQAVPAMAAAARRIPGLRLITIADQTLENPPLPVEHRPWSAESEAASLTAGDIGIAPTPVDRWTLGKCGFKIVQYMAAGLPVIASPVGANAELVREGQTGYLPADDASWVTAIEQLANDVDRRRQFGQAGRERVERELCLERIADGWARLLEASRG
jgi:glycosyltransferase involved in cell wall biosynthesis